MPEQLFLHDNVTGKTEGYSPANARDLLNHRADRFTLVTTGSAPRERREGESATAEEYDLLGNQRVKDNRRVVEETGVSNTQIVDENDPVAFNGEPDKIIDEGSTEDSDNDDDDDDVDPGQNNEGAPVNGIVRSSSGELVDDALVSEIKGLNKTQLVAFAKTNYDIDLDGRKSEDNLRLAIYDAAEKKAS